MSAFEVVLEPHVAAEILDHYQRKNREEPHQIGAGEFMDLPTHRARGWLLGTVSHSAALITNFIPDTYNMPEARVQSATAAASGTSMKKDLKKYSDDLKSWRESVAYHFMDSSIIGFYSVSNGKNIMKRTTMEDGNERIVGIPAEAWLESYGHNPFFSRSNRSPFHIDIRVPTAEAPTLRFTAKQFIYQNNTLAKKCEVGFRIAPESVATNTVMDTVVRAHYGDSVEKTAVPALDIDRLLFEAKGAAKPEMIENICENLKRVVSAAESKSKSLDAKTASSILEAVAALRTERQSTYSSKNREASTQNALMIKYVSSLIAEQVCEAEANMRSNAEHTRQRMRSRRF